MNGSYIEVLGKVIIMVVSTGVYGNCDALYQLLEVQHEYSKFVTVREMCNLGTDDDVDYCMNIINCIPNIDVDELRKVCELFGYDVIINHLDCDLLDLATETLYLVNGLDGLEDKYKVDVYTFDEFKQALCDFIQDIVDCRGGSDEEARKDESEWIGDVFGDTLSYLEEE